MQKATIDKAIETHPDLIENSLYAKYIRTWIKKFGKENVLILPLELLSKDPERYICKLEEFLDIKIDLTKSQISKRINYASQPKSYFLASFARKMRKTINDLGFHEIVMTAKKMGLKKLIYEGGSEILIERTTLGGLSKLFSSDLDELKEYEIPDQIVEEYRINTDA
jgi:hypothetical protein